jgi:hypothetical protein
MVMKVKEIIKEVSIFVDENINEFEFVVDIENVGFWEIDFNDNIFSIDECCNVFIRKEDDKNIEEKYKDNVMKKVIKEDCILYIVM